jgi:hypothetical protein
MSEPYCEKQEPCGYPQLDCVLGVYITKCEDRIEALTAENARLRDAVYIDDLTVTLQGEDRAAAIEGIGRALDLLRADMVDEAKASLRATIAKMKGEKG